jgi:type I restriction enzyme S subunit
MPEKKKSVAPRLRFPEFLNAGPWEVKRLGEIGTIIKGKGISKSDISEQGSLPCIRYGELYTHYSEVVRSVGSFTNVDAADLVLSEENDVIIPASGETIEDIATASCVTTKGVALGGDLNIFRSPVNGVFLAYYIRGTLKPAIAKIAQGISVVHLYPAQLAQLQLGVPHSEEQQKIADCLSSLDEVIELEAKRLDALKAHKKGLLQQLFPREGETTPRLRFPEFRNAGPWEVKRLGEVAQLISERAGDNDYVLLSVTSGVGLVPQTEKFGREIAGKQKKNYYVIRRYDFAYNKSATKEYPQGYVALYTGNEPAAVPNSIFTCFRPDLDRVVPHYLNYLFGANLHGRWLAKAITVGARAHGSLNVDNSDVLNIPLPLPKVAEQQKIADCLSSLDELIQLEAQKLDALKAHKKGLMQQLFPQEVE